MCVYTHHFIYLMIGLEMLSNPATHYKPPPPQPCISFLELLKFLCQYHPLVLPILCTPPPPCVSLNLFSFQGQLISLFSLSASTYGFSSTIITLQEETMYLHTLLTFYMMLKPREREVSLYMPLFDWV